MAEIFSESFAKALARFIVWRIMEETSYTLTRLSFSELSRREREYLPIEGLNNWNVKMLLLRRVTTSS